jgi:hypothetical protein
VFTRVAAGRAQVVREVRAATPLMAALRAPVTARGPWLTAVLTTAGRLGRRPVAVVVEPHRQGRPAALALLALRRRGPRTEIALLGADADPLPGGRARLLRAGHGFRAGARDRARRRGSRALRPPTPRRLNLRRRWRSRRSPSP